MESQTLFRGRDAKNKGVETLSINEHARIALNRTLGRDSLVAPLATQ